MPLTQEFISHSSPLKLHVSEYDALIDRLCESISNLPPIPRAIREEAKRIARLVQTYFPTKGRRRTAIAIVAIGMARGARGANELKDLVYRVKILTGQEIPWGQVQNTFEDLQAFLMDLHFYKKNKKRITFRFTSEEKRILRILKSRE